MFFCLCSLVHCLRPHSLSGLLKLVGRLITRRTLATAWIYLICDMFSTVWFWEVQECLEVFFFFFTSLKVILDLLHYRAFSNKLSVYKVFYIPCDKLPGPRGSQHRALRVTWGLRLFFILGKFEGKKCEKKKKKNIREEKMKKKIRFKVNELFFVQVSSSIHFL